MNDHLLHQLIFPGVCLISPLLRGSNVPALSHYRRPMSLMAPVGEDRM